MKNRMLLSQPGFYIYLYQCHYVYTKFYRILNSFVHYKDKKAKMQESLIRLYCQLFEVCKRVLIIADASFRKILFIRVSVACKSLPSVKIT